MYHPDEPQSGVGAGVPPTARSASAIDSDCPLSEAHFQTLRRAVAAYRPVRAAARTASISAASILVAAALAVVVLLFSPGVSHAIIAVSLCLIGYLEYTGARKMRLGEPAAASHLGWNQVIFIALICLYCITRILDARSGEYLSPEARSQLSQVPDIAAEIQSLVPAAVTGFYVIVMLVSIVLQGALARYYFTRRRHLEALQQGMPPWVYRIFTELLQ